MSKTITSIAEYGDIFYDTLSKVTAQILNRSHDG